jgi:hypothetical protein
LEKSNKLSSMIVLTILVLLCVSFARPVSAIQPRVQSVVPYNVGNDTRLNVTVYHYPEDASIPHYVNVIEVTMGANTTDLTISVQPLSPDNTFTVSYNLGPISGSPTITVKAHCIVNGWSTPFDWTGAIPEFSVLALLVALALFGSVAFEFGKKKQDVHR